MAMITSDVPFEVLQEIHTELLKRLEHKKAQADAGKIERKARFEFMLYMQRITALFGEEFGCDPKDRCDNGSCPPCFEATNEEILAFRNRLQEENAKDIA